MQPPPGLRRTFGLATGTTATVAVGVLIHAEANSGFSPYDKARWLLAIAVGIAGLVCLTQPRWARYAVIVGSIGWVTWLWASAPERLPLELQDAIERVRSALK